MSTEQGHFSSFDPEDAARASADRWYADDLRRRGEAQSRDDADDVAWGNMVHGSYYGVETVRDTRDAGQKIKDFLTKHFTLRGSN